MDTYRNTSHSSQSLFDGNLSKLSCAILLFQLFDMFLHVQVKVMEVSQTQFPGLLVKIATTLPQFTITPAEMEFALQKLTSGLQHDWQTDGRYC